MTLSRTELQRRHAIEHWAVSHLPPFTHVDELAHLLNEPVDDLLACIRREELAATRTGFSYSIMRDDVIDFLARSGHGEKRYWYQSGAQREALDLTDQRATWDLARDEMDHFHNRTEYEIIGAPIMEQPVPPTSRESVQPETGSTEVAPNPNVVCLPWYPDNTPAEIGRAALDAVADIKADRENLELQIKRMKDHEQALVLAAKTASGLSWSAMAELAGTTKSKLVGAYDPKTIEANKQAGQRRLERLRRLPRPDASERQAS